MAKRKLPPPPKVWARVVNGREWEVLLPNGEILRLVDDIDIELARSLVTSIPAFRIGYLMPVIDLRGDADALDTAFAEVGIEGCEYNSLHLFASRDGTRAVVFDHHH